MYVHVRTYVLPEAVVVRVERRACSGAVPTALATKARGKGACGLMRVVVMDKVRANWLVGGLAGCSMRLLDVGELVGPRSHWKENSRLIKSL